jgi:hypothetical protein
MTFFCGDMPAPQPDFDDRPFWQACNSQELRFQCCASCGQARHPPSPVCPRCRSLESQWLKSAGAGSVYTYTVIHHASHDAVKANLPYTVAVVTFDDVPGVRLVTNVSGVAPADVRVGMRVKLWWDEISPGQFVPRCAPAA